MSNELKDIQIYRIIKTNEVCPSQWQFETHCNRTGYIRYRFGCLEIHLSDPEGDLHDAIKKSPIMLARFGDEMDGTLSNERMLHALELLGIINLGDAQTIELSC